MSLSKPSNQHNYVTNISKLINPLSDNTISLYDALNNVAHQLVEMMQYPDNTGVKIVLNGWNIETSSYDPDTSTISQSIIINGVECGLIKVSHHNLSAIQKKAPLSSDDYLLIKNASELIGLNFSSPPAELNNEIINRPDIQLQQVLNFSPVMAFVWELTEGWPVMYAADSIKQLGYTPDDFLNRKINYEDIIHPHDLKHTAEEVNTSISNGATDFIQTYRIKSQDGQFKWIRDWSHIVRNAQGTAIFIQGIIVDMTDSVRLEQRTSHFMQTVHSLYVSLDTNGFITEVNDKTCELLRTNKTKLIGQNLIDTFVPEEKRENASNEMKNTITNNIPGDIRSLETDMTSSDGKIHLVHWSYTTEIDSNGDVDRINAFGLDITKYSETSLRLKDLTDNIPGAVFQYDLYPDGQDSITSMSKGCEDIWEIDRNAIEKDPSLVWALMYPDDIIEMQNSISVSANKLSRWTHEWRIVTNTGKLKWLRGSGLPHRNSSGVVSWNSILTDITSDKNNAENITKALIKTVQVLAAALEKRDPYTAGHEQTVAEIAVKIGKKMELDPHLLKGLELSAMIHDVGKIAIPAEILSKPNHLLDAEFELIKLHSETGAELVRDIDFEWPIADTILQHHERYDGSGYPQGLVGEDILLEARIIGVADTLEAMATHRPYRHALGIEKAAAEILDGKGTRYDPNVAEACLALIESREIIL
jgi:PAS domain S-box-containing protein